MSVGLLDGKVALVTGASRGVGRGVAVMLAAEGAEVIAAARTLTPDEAPRRGHDGSRLPGSLQETVAAIEAAGGKAHAMRCDLTDEADIARTIDRAIGECGQLDIVVNNALPDVSLEGDFWDVTLSAWDTMVAVGPRAYYAVAHHAAPHLIRRRRGLIVNVSAALAAAPGYSTALSACCAAIDRLAQGMADDLRPHNVAAVSFWPGYVRTERVLLGARDEEEGLGLRPGFDPVKDADSPELQGIAIARLAADPDLMRYSGKVQVVTDLAARYGFVDIDGAVPKGSPRVKWLREQRGSIAPLAYD